MKAEMPWAEKGESEGAGKSVLYTQASPGTFSWGAGLSGEKGLVSAMKAFSEKKKKKKPTDLEKQGLCRAAHSHPGFLFRGLSRLSLAPPLQACGASSCAKQG